MPRHREHLLVRILGELSILVGAPNKDISDLLFLRSPRIDHMRFLFFSDKNLGNSLGNLHFLHAALMEIGRIEACVDCHIGLWLRLGSLRYLTINLIGHLRANGVSTDAQCLFDGL